MQLQYSDGVLCLTVDNEVVHKYTYVDITGLIHQIH